MASDLFQIKEDLLKVSQKSLPTQVLEDIVGSNFSKDEEDELLEFVKNNGILSKLNGIYAKFEQKKEFEMAKKIIENPNIDWRILYPLPERYIPIVTEEIEKLNLSKDDYIAVTGSGPFPATAISIADRTEAKITCIERVPKYANLAIEVLKSLGYDSIDVKCEDASMVSYKDFTRVLITLLTDKKEKVLRRIYSTSKCKILLRSTHGIINLLYPKFDHAALSGYNIIGLTKHGYIVDCI